MTTTSEDGVTLYEGSVEPDDEGFPQPVAEAGEDDDPEQFAGDELAEDDAL